MRDAARCVCIMVNSQLYCVICGMEKAMYRVSQMAILLYIL
jgi:hypothetical protein